VWAILALFIGSSFVMSLWRVVVVVAGSSPSLALVASPSSLGDGGVFFYSSVGRFGSSLGGGATVVIP
jgi:hypothetical protein